MKDTIKQKYKDLFIALIDGDDWQGARNLIDNILNVEAQSPVQPTPQVEQVPEPPQATSFDDERQRKLNKMQGD